MKPSTKIATGKTGDGGSLVLSEHDGHHYLHIDGVQLMSTRAASSEQQMAEIGCAAGGGGRTADHVLIGGLGFGFTLRRVLELASPAARVEVAELLPVIVEWNREHLGGVNGLLLDDPRVAVMTADVYDRISRCPDGRYDVVLLDVDNSPDPLVQKGNARLYARRGLDRVRAALNPGGRVVFWSATRDPGFARELRSVFGNAEAIPAKAYPKAKRFTHTLFVADRKG